MPNFNAGKELAKLRREELSFESQEIERLYELPLDEAYQIIIRDRKKRERERVNRVVSYIILFILFCWLVHWFVNLA